MPPSGVYSLGAPAPRGGIAVPSQNHAAEFTCPHYRATSGTKRCESYQEGGTCALPEYFHCIEWEKKNQVHLASVRRGETAAKLGAGPRLDLFGQIVREPPPRKQTTLTAAPQVSMSRSPSPPAAVEDPQPPLRRGFTDDDIKGFKEIGAEVCLSSDEFGEVWLVPEYTGKDRKELTPEHAATVARTLEIFPGARVTSFRKVEKTNDLTEKDSPERAAANRAEEENEENEK
jgi:hypothetical protein